ncbi:MAG TPA: cytochrome C [Candidatus Binatia bacterium]|nr:cytochrome C [Candidatus Binatia bacterium]
MATPETKPALKAVAPAGGKRVEVPIKKATGPGDDKIHTWPHLVRAEFLMSVGVIVLLLVWSLLVDAPLEEPANPTRTQNPSKAPWYFLGLQEMLVFFDPWHAGVVLPSLIILGLMVIPYIDINPKGNGYYCWKDRKWEILTFILGFHILWVSLIIIGTFVRGPGWNWFWFWEKWDVHKVEALTNVDLPYLLGVRDETTATIVGAAVVLLYFVLGFWAFKRFIRRVKGAEYESFMARWGYPRYFITGFLFLNMMAVVFKMLGRHLFNLKYIMVLKTPYFSINI